MTNKNIKYDFKLILITLVIVGVIIASFIGWEHIKVIVRTILENKLIPIIIWVVIVVIFIVHWWKIKRKDIKSEPIFTKAYGSFIDNGLGGLAYATTITTSLTLIKGLFIQYFFTDKQYFTEFSNIDFATIFGISCFLLYYAIQKVVNIAKEAYIMAHTEKVLTEGKIEVVQDNNK